MIKPRVLPVVITAAITASVLFGGWAIYNQVAVAAPLGQVVKEVEGVVTSSKPVMTKDKVTIELALEKEANIRTVYEQIAASGKDVFGDRKLHLDIQMTPSKQLDELWSAALFDVAEAMENKSYSDIPEALLEAAESYSNVTVITEMDDTNVYITLKDEQSIKYVVLPRIPAQMGVWTNA